MPKSSIRSFSIGDRIVGEFDRALRSVTKGVQSAGRPSPAERVAESDLTTEQRAHSAGLMRVNHTGEVCAQALYQGQALTAKLSHIRDEMEQAAAEEVDHLAWCEHRLEQLQSHRSVLNPVWYGLSFGLGAAAGLVSDRVSLGFVAATEEQVCHHLEEHLQRLPESDAKSRAIVGLMLEDEYRHGQNALSAGGYVFPRPLKAAMHLVSKAMTQSSYRI